MPHYLGLMRGRDPAAPSFLKSTGLFACPESESVFGPLLRCKGFGTWSYRLQPYMQYFPGHMWADAIYYPTSNLGTEIFDQLNKSGPNE
jgi:hypothetical protein